MSRDNIFNKTVGYLLVIACVLLIAQQKLILEPYPYSNQFTLWSGLSGIVTAMICVGVSMRQKWAWEMTCILCAYAVLTTVTNKYYFYLEDVLWARYIVNLALIVVLLAIVFRLWGMRVFTLLWTMLSLIIGMSAIIMKAVWMPAVSCMLGLDLFGLLRTRIIEFYWCSGWSGERALLIMWFVAGISYILRRQKGKRFDRLGSNPDKRFR
jgi:hypothetical protein